MLFSNYKRSLRHLVSNEKEEEAVSRKRQEKLNKNLSHIIKAKLLPVIKFKSSDSKQTDIFPLSFDPVEINKLPDGPEKYQQIVAYYQSTQTQFVDANFVASERVLGMVTTPLVAGWRRPDPTSQRFIAGYSPSDVLQGALGDCYFLSALSVLGEEKTKNIFVSKEEEDWKVGAILLRFNINGDEVFVIIDTLFPVNTEGKWAFASSEQNDEMWPTILEKAYAKLYSSYEAIIGGRVHYALSDLTGGYPEELKTEKYTQNSKLFFEQLKDYKDKGYLLGCSSLAQVEGESKVSKSGIVQGHAYAILDLLRIDEERLIKLRNPHGSRGIEWKGDWSDKSLKWTEENKKEVGLEVAEDGIFFMGFDDFLYEFKCVYICRIFDEKKWKKLEKIDGEWKAESAAGLPSKKFNPNCQIWMNPQYGLKVTKKTNIFVVMSQKEIVDMFRGYFILFYFILFYFILFYPAFSYFNKIIILKASFQFISWCRKMMEKWLKLLQRSLRLVQLGLQLI